MPSAAASTLADVARAVGPLGLRWYLFGAQAAIHYGSPRVTADVDVTIELGSLSPDDLMRHLRDVGIEPRVELDEEFVARTRVLPMVHVATQMAVDVVLAGPGLEEYFLGRTRTIRFESVELPIAAPGDIVIMKVLAGRPKDFDDVVGILRADPEGLSVEDTRATLRELEELLGQSDLVAPFESALERAKRK